MLFPASDLDALPLPPLIVLGDASPGGAYVLRIRVLAPLSLPFGRFKKGAQIPIPRGEILYVGSAMNGLARRLIRHASRSYEKPPHPIRGHMLEQFPQLGLGDHHKGVRSKQLHWHVDYLLDQEQVQLLQALALRSPLPLEAEVGQMLEREETTFIIARGLGARDIRGNTHLLGVRAPEAWWRSLPARLEQLLAGPHSPS